MTRPGPVCAGMTWTIYSPPCPTTRWAVSWGCPCGIPWSRPRRMAGCAVLSPGMPFGMPSPRRCFVSVSCAGPCARPWIKANWSRTTPAPWSCWDSSPGWSRVTPTISRSHDRRTYHWRISISGGRGAWADAGADRTRHGRAPFRVRAAPDARRDSDRARPGARRSLGRWCGHPRPLRCLAGRRRLGGHRSPFSRWWRPIRRDRQPYPAATCNGCPARARAGGGQRGPDGRCPASPTRVLHHGHDPGPCRGSALSGGTGQCEGDHHGADGLHGPRRGYRRLGGGAPRRGLSSRLENEECRRARDAKRDIPVPLSPCARATTCTCRGRPAPGSRLRHCAPTPGPLRRMAWRRIGCACIWPAPAPGPTATSPFRPAARAYAYRGLPASRFLGGQR